MKLKITTILILSLIIFAGCSAGKKKKDGANPVKVELKKGSSGWQLYRDGQPFFIKGAGLECGDIESLAAHGGNAMRTWRTDSRCHTANEILDKALDNNLMVCMGIEIARERHGFDYNDTTAVRKQFEYAKGEVLKYKDHPALLAWGIGNELNLRATNMKVWDAVNDISEMIQKIDPYHPTTTMLAGSSQSDIQAVMEKCPSLDFISFQLYGDIVNLPRYIKESGYNGAYVVSEWGPTGHWEMPKTEWGRPIEQTSHEKANAYIERYNKVIAGQKEQCIGSFVFLWGQKQERTPTWYGMFLESGHTTEAVDVMQYVWTGRWPENRAPMIKEFRLNGKSSFDHIHLKPGSIYIAEAMTEDHEGDQITYRWEIIPEVPENHQSDGGDFEPRQPSVMEKDSQKNILSFTSPKVSGEYRLFVYAYDQHNNAATANIPFYIKE